MNYTIKELPETERPRERLKQVGPENLSDKELIAIVLKTGTKNKNVTELALEVLKEYPISTLKDVSLSTLQRIKGIGEAKAIELLATIEIGKRIFNVKPKKLKKLSSANEIYMTNKNLFFNKNQEHLYILYFNSNSELIETKLMFIGTINESVAHPREVFKEAYRLSATYIVCIHNHPSNNTTPSKADIAFTEALRQTGLIHGIKLVDHIIFGYDNFFSFYENKKTVIQEDYEK
ncbi:MAG: DNA repair protein RadC [Bacilli bacterium]|nr:DNA repair protein RadC [Bacilli bacterium]